MGRQGWGRFGAIQSCGSWQCHFLDEEAKAHRQVPSSRPLARGAGEARAHVCLTDLMTDDPEPCRGVQPGTEGSLYMQRIQLRKQCVVLFSSSTCLFIYCLLLHHTIRSDCATDFGVITRKTLCGPKLPQNTFRRYDSGCIFVHRVSI